MCLRHFFLIAIQAFILLQYKLAYGCCENMYRTFKYRFFNVSKKKLPTQCTNLILMSYCVAANDGDDGDVNFQRRLKQKINE